MGIQYQKELERMACILGKVSEYESLVEFCSLVWQPSLYSGLPKLRPNDIIKNLILWLMILIHSICNLSRISWGWKQVISSFQGGPVKLFAVCRHNKFIHCYFHNIRLWDSNQTASSKKTSFLSVKWRDSNETNMDGFWDFDTRNFLSY